MSFYVYVYLWLLINKTLLFRFVFFLKMIVSFWENKWSFLKTKLSLWILKTEKHFWKRFFFTIVFFQKTKTIVFTSYFKINVIIEMSAAIVFSLQSSFYPTFQMVSLCFSKNPLNCLKSRWLEKGLDFQLSC